MIKYSEVIDEISGYKSIRAELGNGVELSIPTDPANSDYQAYLNKDNPQVEHLTEIPTSGD